MAGHHKTYYQLSVCLLAQQQKGTDDKASGHWVNQFQDTECMLEDLQYVQ